LGKRKNLKKEATFEKSRSLGKKRALRPLVGKVERPILGRNHLPREKTSPLENFRQTPKDRKTAW